MRTENISLYKHKHFRVRLNNCVKGTQTIFKKMRTMFAPSETEFGFVGWTVIQIVDLRGQQAEPPSPV